ncbi:protein of unknown function [Methylocella tundrae]|uniref:Uncharacterized protein n=1 Tax=Methylocella tundrae TaxID=227605 RepID=A0A4U8Z679_METTU|nr:protein of unknown function [Methylocella tundrae]
MRAPYASGDRPRACRLSAEQSGGRHLKARPRCAWFCAPAADPGETDRRDRRRHPGHSGAEGRWRGDRGRAQLHDAARRQHARNHPHNQPPARHHPGRPAHARRVSAPDASLERFPIEWSHSIDQKSLQIQKLEHILVDQIEPI